MRTIAFRVESIPVAQPRQRSAFIGGHIRNYTPAKSHVNAFKAHVAYAAKQVYNDKPLDVPLSLTLEFVFPRPESMMYKKKLMPREPKACKPDFDNLAKSVCDALNGLLWRDDSLVCEAKITKWIASGDEQPHVFIMIEPLGVRW